MSEFAEVAVLPTPGDNAAVVTVELPPGTSITMPDGSQVRTIHRVPVGHRFVITDVAAGEPVLSWGTSFGRALVDLPAGSYVCTERSLARLVEHHVTDLPATATVRNEEWRRYTAADGFHIGQPAPLVPNPRTFRGFARERGRYGTRNYVAVVGLTSREGAFAEEVARRSHTLITAEDLASADGVDGVVPVAHTEGDGPGTPNNIELLLRTLVGMINNPNLGAVILVERPGATVTVETLQTFAQAHNLAWVEIPYLVITRTGSFADDVARTVAAVADIVPEVRAQRRVEAPLAALAIGMQCGGSDAFSGVSANPLSGAVAREVVYHGGTAVLAETDELIGSEGYILSNVASAEVAERFMQAVETFTERVGWHGHSAEGNPSGGNLLRGLHNIVLKSLGAARKKDPALRLEGVIAYGEPVHPQGFLFMDSPGNDLESVAGQIGSGCNLISFTTGNGSITNFPFVPTIKYITTTERFQLLRHDMDVNAGRYLDGMDFDELTQEIFEYNIEVASGRRTAGELAGHSQVQIWRDWPLAGPVDSVVDHGHGTKINMGLPSFGQPHGEDLGDAKVVRASLADHLRSGAPVVVAGSLPSGALPSLQRISRGSRSASESVALILPTSLCAGQIAAGIAERATRENWHGGRADRAVALPHTEGCGSSSGDSEEIYTRTMINYIRHPNTGWALLIEHGCEKTHNDHFRVLLREAGFDPSTVGFASIQADGGIQAATSRVKDWFDERIAEAPQPVRGDGSWAGVVVGLCGVGADLDRAAAEACLVVGQQVVAAGGSVVLSASDPVRELLAQLGMIPVEAEPTLAHGQRIEQPGWHLMNSAGADRLETLTGLGATGAEVIMATSPGPGQRFVPVLRVAGASDPDADVVIGAGGDVATAVAEVLNQTRTVVARSSGNEGFQFTRGLLGVSL